jgi:UPF0755 protein
MENFSSPNSEIEFTGNSFNRSSFIRGITISVFVIVVFFTASYFLFFSAPSDFPDQTIINIEKGSTLRSISEDLKLKNIIRSKVLFEAFVIVYGDENHIAEGDYLLERKLPVFEVARRISRRDRRLAPVKITIPEGFDANQIANAFSSKLKNFNTEGFLLEAKNKEGYLFPDTYFFSTTDDEKDVLKYMSDNFNKKVQSLLKSITSSGKNQNEIIIMASLIEREAKGDNDRGIISGILWNRISKKMPLQVDAAPETYKTRGLPQSPICNPGLEAIKASLNPVSSTYFYYLHDKEGLIHYARSFTEHKQNISKYLR